jgi:hypothetical protein
VFLKNLKSSGKCQSIAFALPMELLREVATMSESPLNTREEDLEVSDILESIIFLMFLLLIFIESKKINKL